MYIYIALKVDEQLWGASQQNDTQTKENCLGINFSDTVNCHEFLLYHISATLPYNYKLLWCLLI